MQLDSTRIAIRERLYFDILDLGLRVVQRHALPLAAAAIVGIVPMAVLDYWLLSALGYHESGFDVFSMIPLLAVLVAWQIPLATAPITLSLGQLMFAPQVDWRRLARDLAGSLPQLLWFQVFVRGAALVPVVSGIMLYAGWPYLNEVILLERNPLLASRAAGRPTTWRRSWALHTAESGILLGRWILALVVGLPLTLAIWGTTAYLWSMLTEQSVVNTWFEQPALATSELVSLHLAVWLLVAWFAVVRFLSYLDLRIRNEGWEIELRMRAERARLTRNWAQAG